MTDLYSVPDTTPDPTGEFFEDGTHNGAPAYRNADSSTWIWKSVPGSWFITDTPENFPANYWSKPPGDPTGHYTAGGGATFDVDVAAP